MAAGRDWGRAAASAAASAPEKNGSALRGDMGHVRARRRRVPGKCTDSKSRTLWELCQFSGARWSVCLRLAGPARARGDMRIALSKALTLLGSSFVPAWKSTNAFGLGW